MLAEESQRGRASKRGKRETRLEYLHAGTRREPRERETRWEYLETRRDLGER